MFFDISEDAFLESLDAGKDAAPELVLGQVAEESFDHVEPTAAGGREVKMNALVACRLALNRRVFVGGIVVDEGRNVKVYWMHVAVPLTAPLSKLDDFLRQTWLECCGHLSAFEIGGKRYASEPMDQEMSMRARLSEVLEVGMKFFYEYDYGSPNGSGA